MLHINYSAAIVAAVATFVVGSMWYNPLLFGKVWLKLQTRHTN